MIPFPMGAVDKMKKRITELTDLAWECRILDKHAHPADARLSDLCEDCAKKAHAIIEQAKDDLIAEGTKLLSRLGSQSR